MYTYFNLVNLAFFIYIISHPDLHCLKIGWLPTVAAAAITDNEVAGVTDGMHELMRNPLTSDQHSEFVALELQTKHDEYVATLVSAIHDSALHNSAGTDLEITRGGSYVL